MTEDKWERVFRLLGAHQKEPGYAWVTDAIDDLHQTLLRNTALEAELDRAGRSFEAIADWKPSPENLPSGEYAPYRAIAAMAKQTARGAAKRIRQVLGGNQEEGR